MKQLASLRKLVHLCRIAISTGTVGTIALLARQDAVIWGFALVAMTTFGGLADAAWSAVSHARRDTVALADGGLPPQFRPVQPRCLAIKQLAAYRAESRADAFCHFRHMARHADEPRPHTSAASRWRSNCATGQSA